MPTKKLEYIDILRGIAILLVVEAHSTRLIPNRGPFLNAISDLGTLGVQLFFVASALTLCLSMQGRELNRREITGFYLRRFFRIAPLYYVGIALYGGLSSYYASAGLGELYNGDYIFSNVLANVLLIHGIYAPANNNIVPGGWSIGCEVLFYALFPYLFSRIDNESKCRKFLFLAVALNLLFQSVFALILTKPLALENRPFLTYFFLNQLPVFAIGMRLYFSLQSDSRPSFALAKFAFCFALTALAFRLEPYLPLSYAWIPTLAALSFFYLAHFFAALNSTPTLDHLLARTVAAVGRNSYSIYIFHFLFAWNLLGTTSILLQIPALKNPFVAWPVLLIFNLAGSYAVALVSGRLIEAPGIALGRRLARRIAG